MSRTIDLNADLGEGCPWDEAMLARVSSASIACGGHAGTPQGIAATLRLAAERGVVVGAHPGYADPANFGRVDHDLDDAAIAALLDEQVDRLAAWADAAGVALRYVKAHGALYNQAQRDPRVANAVARALALRGLPVLGQPGSQLAEACRRVGLAFVAEGFVDRRYRPDGTLVPRSEPGAVLSDPAEVRTQILALVDRGIATLCVHGDAPHSVALADLSRATLDEAGVTVRGFA